MPGGFSFSARGHLMSEGIDRVWRYKPIAESLGISTDTTAADSARRDRDGSYYRSNPRHRRGRASTVYRVAHHGWRMTLVQLQRRERAISSRIWLRASARNTSKRNEHCAMAYYTPFVPANYCLRPSGKSHTANGKVGFRPTCRFSHGRPG